MLVDSVTYQSKMVAFVDFSTKEAAEVVIKAWNNKSMVKYPNRLRVEMYSASHVKLTKEERERTRERPSNFTNLFVDKLPYAFERQDVLDLFSQYGQVLDIKMKKPTKSNLPLNSIQFMPCAAYVNFKDTAQAKAAIEALQGKQILAGGPTLKIDYY